MAEMTREEIEKKAVERFPDTGFYGIFQEKRQAYIEGALMVVEANESKVIELLGNNPQKTN
jgi:hypothetical protein